METRIRELESELDAENRRNGDICKNLRKSERTIKELTFAGDEDKKNHERMQSLIDQLQGKVKSYKKQIEEAEEIAALNLAKYRKVAGALGDAAAAADAAEQEAAMRKARARSASLIQTKRNLVTEFSQLSINFGGLGLDVFDSLSSDCLGLLFVVPVCLGVGLSLGFKVGDNILVFPAGFSGKTTNWGEFSVWLQFDLLEGRWDDDASHLVVWGWDTLKSLQAVESSLASVSLVWKHSSDDVLEHLGWRTSVEWTT